MGNGFDEGEKRAKRIILILKKPGNRTIVLALPSGERYNNIKFNQQK